MATAAPSAFTVTRRRRVWHRGVDNGLLGAFSAATGCEVMPAGAAPRAEDGDTAVALVEGSDQDAVRETLRWPVALWLDADCPWPPLPAMPGPDGWVVMATTATAYEGCFSEGLLAGLARRLGGEPACAAREIAMTTAVQELLANAVIHGNLEVSSEMRNTSAGFRRYTDLIVSRLTEPAYARRLISVEMRRQGQELVISVRDQGPGYRTAPAAPRPHTGFCGLGLALVRDMVDDVGVSDHGRATTLRWNLSRAVPTL